MSLLSGEMRDLGTVTTALRAAETGHLVISTLHTTDAPQTVPYYDMYSAGTTQQHSDQLSQRCRGRCIWRPVINGDPARVGVAKGLAGETPTFAQSRVDRLLRREHDNRGSGTTPSRVCSDVPVITDAESWLNEPCTSRKLRIEQAASLPCGLRMGIRCRTRLYGACHCPPCRSLARCPIRRVRCDLTTMQVRARFAQNNSIRTGVCPLVAGPAQQQDTCR